VIAYCFLSIDRSRANQPSTPDRVHRAQRDEISQDQRRVDSQTVSHCTLTRSRTALADAVLLATIEHGSRGVARVKTYGEVLREYEFHPGAKSADAKGKPSGKQTFGLLRRRHVRGPTNHLHRHRIQPARRDECVNLIGIECDGRGFERNLSSTIGNRAQRSLAEVARFFILRCGHQGANLSSGVRTA